VFVLCCRIHGMDIFFDSAPSATRASAVSSSLSSSDSKARGGRRRGVASAAAPEEAEPIVFRPFIMRKRQAVVTDRRVFRFGF
jgi:hypothetical protein